MPRKKAVKNENTEKIIRNYDEFSMEKRIYNLDHAPQRSYDIYSMEKRIHDLEVNGGGGTNLTTLNATPTTSAQEITPESPYDGFNLVNISAVTASIDENIIAGNIKKDVKILGVTGTYEAGGGGNLTTLNATPTTSAQTITPESPYDGFDEVNISAVTASIDANIKAENIAYGITILGVTGTFAYNNLQIWLNMGGVTGTYSTLADVLADSTAVSTLMASTPAVNYLKYCYDWINDITADQGAMSEIGDNTYCKSTLMSDPMWSSGILNSAYVDEVLSLLTPAMTSTTTPSGEVIASSDYNSGYARWHAFDQDTTTYWASQAGQGTGAYIGYVFNTAQTVLCAKADAGNQGASCYGIIEASDDGTTWTAVSSRFAYGPTGTPAVAPITTPGAHRYYRMRQETGSGTFNTCEIDLLG